MAKFIGDVGEDSSLPLTLELEQDGAAYVPTTVEYRVDCLTNGLTTLTYTSVTPATSMAITVPGSANIIKNDTLPYEIRQMSVRVNDGLSTEWLDPDPITWRVINNLIGR